ncbi:MAG: adenosylcobinamide-phosphate synthase CbiB [bacterium]|nr:adenosylcobinamide-phosphate synthase CbiB [bacterium]
MLDLAIILVLAVIFDLLLGDPRRWHPVVGIGNAAGFFARILRKASGEGPAALIAAGAATAAMTVAVCAIAAGAIVYAAALVPKVALVSNVAFVAIVPNLAAALIVSFMIAVRSLEDHALVVYRALVREDLSFARERAGWIVGRDTHDLPEPELVRATVECVAESISDGVSGPLFFAAVGGLIGAACLKDAGAGAAIGAAMGAVGYRAINTMDSMFGYRNARYTFFGRVPARLDDLANLLPARLTVPAIILAALIARESFVQSARIWWRDALKHTSPNAGQGEAAFAGALNIQLGGTNLYAGVPVVKPLIGPQDRSAPLERAHILRAVRLMFLTVLWFTIGLAGVILAL